MGNALEFSVQKPNAPPLHTVLQTLQKPEYSRLPSISLKSAVVACYFLLHWWVLAIFLTSLDFTIIATAIPYITAEFHSLDNVAWYGSASFLVTASFQAAWGKAYSFFPLKTVFLAAIFFFEIGSLVCAVAPSSVALIVGRAVAGLRAAGVNTGSFTLAAFCAPPKKRAIFTGLIGFSYGIVSVVGALLGGVFTDQVTWRWCFYINLPVGGVSALFIILFFQTLSASKSPSSNTTLLTKVRRMDLPGAFILMACVTCFILALQWEMYQSEAAMVPPRLLRRHILPSTIGFFFGSYIVIIYYTPIDFQSIMGVSPIESGVRNLPFIIAVSLFTSVYPALILTIAAAVATIGGGLIYTFDLDTKSGKWIGYQILAGVGNGLGVQVPMIMAQGNSSVQDMAAATAILMCLQTIGGAFMMSAAQAAFVNHLLYMLPLTAPDVDPSAVIATGATELREVFGQDLHGVLVAYIAGLEVAFAFGRARMGVAFLALFVPW
ncbi:major facilitator superfamily domain-containing protein [Aspergillus multicolor]|uniref:MDR family MFS transporter n=1 Tax=Aspergillus multicolor TaxID=41759 RepID=UPI003CCE216C